MPAFDGCYGQGCELLVFQWAFGLNLTDDILTEKKEMIWTKIRSKDSKGQVHF